MKVSVPLTVYFLFCIFRLAVHAQTVEPLLEQLDSPVLNLRNEAQQKLYHMGPDVESLLPDEKCAEEEYSAEVQIRLKNLRRMFLKDSIRRQWEQIQFRIVERSFSHEKQRLTFNVDVDWPGDERLTLLRFVFPLNEFQLKDVKNNVLAQANRASGVFDVPLTPEMRTIRIRVVLPVDTATENKISSDTTFLHGRGKLLFVAAPKEFVIPLDEMADREIRHENAVVSIRHVDVEQNSDEKTVHCRVRVEYDNALDALQSHQIWIERIPTTLRTPTDRRFPHSVEVRQEEKTANIFEGTHSFKIPPDIDPQTLDFLYTVPTIILEKTLGFQCDTDVK